MGGKNGQKGISLMEVLVTVGLIAIIGSIAVPSYRNYMRTSKTAEAQSSLGQIYMAEKSFFLQHRFYTTDLLTIGVAPDGQMFYNAGFGAHNSSKLATYTPTLDANAFNFYGLCGKNFGDGGNCGDNDKGCIASCAFQDIKLKDASATPPNLNGTFTPVSIPTAATTTLTSFIAYAAADLINKEPKDIGNTTDKDIWCINNYKQVGRVRDGTRVGNSATGETCSTTGGGTTGGSTTGGTTGGSTTGGTTGSTTGTPP